MIGVTFFQQNIVIFFDKILTAKVAYGKKKIAKVTRWHKERQINGNVLRHPTYSPCTFFDIRLGLASDNFNLMEI